MCKRVVPPSPRTGSPKDLGTKILVPIVNLIMALMVHKNLIVNLVVNLVMNRVVNRVVNLVVNLVVNTLSSKRLDAKRHYVILAKALDGIWPVGHACAVLC